MSVRLRQAAEKQVLALLSSATEKRRKQLWKLRELQRAGLQTKYLQSKIDRHPLVKPSCSRINPELDSRFVKDFEKSKNFLFVRISSMGIGSSIRIPLIETKTSKKWSEKGVRKRCIRLCEDRIELIYDVPDAPKTGTQVVGADQGISTCLSLSNGLTTHACRHGHSLSSIQKTLARRKRGSKGFRRAQEHRKNHINWSLNQLRSSLTDVKEVRLERVHDIRRHKNQGRFMSHWTYPLIKQKLERFSEEEGFLLREVSNEFRSQRCSQCGWVRKSNRKGKTFRCTLCGFHADADLNAASNLEIELYELPCWVRLRRLNLRGFFWGPEGFIFSEPESIVPVALERFHDISMSC